MSFFVPTRFVWRFGGRQVHLCGSFTRWVETVPMAPVEGSPGVFAVVVHLPPGYHQYKFIVDGKWRHDETAPFMPDPLGNVNNWLFVRRIETPPAGGMTFEQQQQQQQLLQQQQQHVAAAMQQHLQQQSSSQQALAAQLTAQAQVQHQHPQQQQAMHGHPQEQPQPLQPPLQQQQPQQQQQPPPQQLPQPPQPPQQQQQEAPSSSSDVDMTAAEPAVPHVIAHNPKEPEYTCKKIRDFMYSHTAYELIPESGKVVLLDVDLPVRQAFHALHEQGAASAPLWDSQEGTIIGIISASDFIHILTRLTHNISSGANPLSEAEMDAHTIRGMREEAALQGRGPKSLVHVQPDDDLGKVVRRLFENKCSMAPILSCDPGGLEIPSALQLATLSGVLACLMRHFRASLASLPLLAQPIGTLPIGTWSPDCAPSQQDMAGTIDCSASLQRRKLLQLHTVQPGTPLTTALTMLLETGVSALPVVDEHRCLLDIYARADITKLAKGNAYNRLQWEAVTVGQALALAAPGPAAWAQSGTASSHVMGMEFSNSAHMGHMAGDGQVHGPGGQALGGTTSKASRVFVCTKEDALRTVVERLSVPGVRRLIVIQPDTRKVEGLISLSDVLSFLFVNQPVELTQAPSVPVAPQRPC